MDVSFAVPRRSLPELFQPELEEVIECDLEELLAERELENDTTWRVLKESLETWSRWIWQKDSSGQIQ